METNWPWTWKLIVLMTSNMILIIIRPLVAISRRLSELTVMFQHEAPSLCLWKLLLTGCSWEKWWGNRPLDRSLPSTLVTDIQKKANFPCHQPCLFDVFWAASSQTPLLVTIRVELMWRWMAGREGGRGRLKQMAWGPLLGSRFYSDWNRDSLKSFESRSRMTWVILYW